MPEPDGAQSDEGVDLASLGIGGGGAVKHAGHGVLRAMTAVSMGCLGGVGTLLVAPVIGAREGGVKGFAQGVGAGIVGAVALPLIGVAAGCKDIYDGVRATPAAVEATNSGKEWDEASGKWILYDLKVECRDVLDRDAASMFSEQRKKYREQNGSAHGDGAAPKAKAAVADTVFYDLLGVPPDATEAQVKKAYYKLALKLHPDKNVGDQSAASKFQKVGEAYQVLSNPQLRAKYDAQGKEDLDSMNFMDSSTFFSMVFGSEQFEQFVGQLKLSTYASHQDDDMPPEEMHFREVQRQVRCADNLVKLIAPLVEDGASEEAFHETMATMAADLAATPFGATLLGVIGYVYDMAGSKHLGRHNSLAGIDGHLLSLRQKAHIVCTKLETAKTFVHVALKSSAASSAAKKAQKLEGAETKESARLPPDAPVVDTGSGSGEQRSIFEENAHASGARAEHHKAAQAKAKAVAEEKQQAMMLSFLDVMWKISVVDIESTLRVACHKVLYDHSVDLPTRLRRAKALALVGKAFAGHKAKHAQTWQQSLFATMHGGPPPEEAQPDDDKTTTF